MDLPFDGSEAQASFPGLKGESGAPGIFAEMSEKQPQVLRLRLAQKAANLHSG
jgi:hypothetical protein